MERAFSSHGEGAASEGSAMASIDEKNEHNSLLAGVQGGFSFKTRAERKQERPARGKL